jgi:pyruvate/2-oxoglutarate dehydrogenase complex dihydrolipoamide acyltransferase (E2) component
MRSVGDELLEIETDKAPVAYASEVAASSRSWLRRVSQPR